MTVAEHRKLPTLICIDVEPDARAPELGRQPDWGGFEQIAEQLQTIRPHIEDAIGSPVHFSWFLRMDPQIALLHGAPGWVVGRYRSLLSELELAGDEIGLHIHPWRWDAQTETWVADFANLEWGREAVRCGFDAFREQFGRSCRAIRFGDRWLTGGIVALASKMGARFDLTPEPGVKPEPPPEAHNGLMPDYTPTPIVPYRPAFVDPVKRGRGRIRQRPWMIPLTTVEFGPALRRVVDRLAATPLPSTMGDPIAGWIDAANCEWVAGWAPTARSPDRPSRWSSTTTRSPWASCPPTSFVPTSKPPVSETGGTGSRSFWGTDSEMGLSTS